MKLFLEKQRQLFLLFEEVMEKTDFSKQSLAKNEEEKAKKHSF
jgi:hypothetical protein